MKYRSVWRQGISIYSFMLKLRQDGRLRLAPEPSEGLPILAEGWGSQIYFIEQSEIKTIDSLAQLNCEIIPTYSRKARTENVIEIEETKMLLCRCLFRPVSIEELPSRTIPCDTFESEIHSFQYS